MADVMCFYDLCNYVLNQRFIPQIYKVSPQNIAASMILVFATEMDSRVATKYNALQMIAITPPVLYSRDHLKGSPLLEHGKAQISNYNCVSPDFQFKMLISHTQCSNGMT